MVTDTYADLRALAEGATPGPWRWRNSNGEAHLFGVRTLVVMGFRRLGMHGAQPVFRDHETNVLVDAGRANINAFPDAAYIAAANPARILALLADLDAARSGHDAELARAIRAESAERVLTAEVERLRRQVEAVEGSHLEWQRKASTYRAELDRLVLVQDGWDAMRDATVAEREALAAKVEAVRALHFPVPIQDVCGHDDTSKCDGWETTDGEFVCGPVLGYCCGECIDESGDHYVDHPCATIRALDADGTP